MPRTKTIGKKLSPLVTFRLADEPLAALDERAALLSLGRNELARKYVLEGLLAAQEREQLHGAIEGLQSVVRELRREFSHAVQTLLVSAGRIEPEQAEAWIQENFNLR